MPTTSLPDCGATSPNSQWPAYLSPKPELPELLSILGMTHTNRSFSPWPGIRPQLPPLPTLADWFGLTARSYPDGVSLFNRYRPFQTAQDLALALDHSSALFLRPVGRSPGPPMAQVRALVQGPRTPQAVLTEAVSEG
ncbi:hypothetical protein [Nonomuraea sp. NPDC049400]|uniref:hypothetical protein n=1 Tax=Nonomuraea sp. NPDC049400 TaxID=3364352 RepID=UPI003791D874